MEPLPSLCAVNGLTEIQATAPKVVLGLLPQKRISPPTQYQLHLQPC